VNAQLRISPDLSLPLEAVTEPIGILAVRRAGKSNAAVVMAEEMYRNHLHWVAIDPKGDWWGIRSSGDGQGEGLSVPILGGRHGDIPLEPGAGAFVADLIVDQGLTCVLDVSTFASEAEKIRFLLAFGDRLFRRKDQEQPPTHVFFEEADDYIPQKPFAEQARLVHVMARILKQGGSRGLGGTVISQRSAVVNKDVLTQVQTLFALRTTSPQDRKAVRDWVSFSGENPDIVETLPGLADGEAWVWSPNFLHRTERFRFRQRWTFDSGATPSAKRSMRPPATLADVDLTALQTQMHDTIERAKEQDPRELRKRIRVLEQQLTQRPTEKQVETITVAVPVLNGQLPALREAIGKLGEVSTQLITVGETIANVGGSIVSAIDRVGVAQRESTAVRPRVAAATPALRPAAIPVKPRAPAPPSVEGDVKLGQAERTFLAALTQHRNGLSVKQISLITGYSAKSGYFANVLGKLRSAGLVTRTHPVQVTEAGVAAAGDVEPLPAPGPALIEFWYGRLGKAERAFLEAFVAVAPDTLDRQRLSEVTGYSYESGYFANVLGRLRSLGLVDGWRASSDLIGY
jgi:hypothetical protein